nr:arginine--tRNA ligase [Marinicella sp. W31]MDC2877523.1 arginine--tRNA ligase [Marinicella sp. W31]
MNLFTDFEQRLSERLLTIEAVAEKRTSLDFSRLVVEPPRDPSHGDIAINAALVLAKPLGKKPRDLAAEIVLALESDEDIAELSIAGPGFINIRLSDAFWKRMLLAALREAEDFGRSTTGANRKINVEYVSANPTGPMHVGHCRGAVVGDTLANILGYAGFDVTKEYYINDAGAQIDVLARSVFLRYREALGEDVGAIPEGLYPGTTWSPSARR